PRSRERQEGRWCPRRAGQPLTARCAMRADPITIELLNRSEVERVHVGEPVPLHLLIRCPSDGSAVELRDIVSRDEKVAEIEADLFERDVTLRPAEVYRCTVVVRLRAVGMYTEPLFQVQVAQDGRRSRPLVPTPIVRVVPSLLREV